MSRFNRGPTFDPNDSRNTGGTPDGERTYRLNFLYYFANLHTKNPVMAVACYAAIACGIPFTLVNFN